MKDTQEIRASAQLIRTLAEDIIDEIAVVFAAIGGTCIETDNRTGTSNYSSIAERAEKKG